MKPLNLHLKEDQLSDLIKRGTFCPSAEEEFADAVELASRICNVPFTLVSLLEINQHWYKAMEGKFTQDTSREMAICAYTIPEQESFYEITDTMTAVHSGLNNVELNGQIRYYAVAPIISDNGNRIGSLCIADTKPNHLDAHQVFALKVLSRQVAKMLELKIKIAKLENSNKDLKNENEIQGRMLSVVAHDVRNPINAIKSVMDFMTSADITEQEKKNLTQAFSDQLDITLDLLNNLVNWSKVRMGNKDNMSEYQSLNHITDTVLRQFNLSAKMKNNEMLNLVEKDLFTGIDCNMLRFVIRNLVANSMKFTENGKISVYAQSESDQVILVVSDTGIGMSEEKKKNLFSKTNKNSTPGTRNEKGSGLGLILAQYFLECMDATVHIESEEGKGTSFYINFKK